MISSLDAKAWMSITMTPTSAVLISLGLHSVLLSSFSHQSSSYMPTISHWNLEPYMPFLKASQNMTRAHVSLKLPKIIRVSFCLRISNWSLISSLKPAEMKNNAFSQCPKRTALPRSTLRARPAWLGEGSHRRARKGKESNWVTLWGYHSEVIILQLLVFQLRDKVVVSLSKQKKKKSKRREWFFLARLMKLVSLMAAVDAASCHGLLLLLSVHYYNTIPCTYYSVFSPQSATDVPNIFFLRLSGSQKKSISWWRRAKCQNYLDLSLVKLPSTLRACLCLPMPCWHCTHRLYLAQ